MENIMLFYVVLYMILGLVIYHSIFEIWYFNLGKALLGELFGAFVFALLMTGLTLKFWGIALVIIILLGLALAAKVNSPVGKKIVVGVFVIVAIITAITGINYNKQEKEKEQEAERQEQETAEEQELDYTSSDSGTYLNENVPYFEGENQDQYPYESYDYDNDNDDDYDYDNDDDYEEYSEYILPNSSEEILTEADLENLSAQELTYARNEIYARHGCIFKSSELNDYFASMPWYIADDTFDGTLGEIEQQNASFISEYQKNNGLEYKVN